MSIAALMQEMADKGASLDVILLAVRAIEAEQNKAADNRAKAAERKRRQRERERDSHGTVTGQSEDSPEQPLSLSPNENNSNPHTHTPEPKPRARKGAFVLPPHIPAAEWAAFVEMRQRIRKPLTDEGKTLAVGKLNKLAEDGWPPGDVLNHAVMSSNQGLWPPPQDYRNGRSGSRLLPKTAQGSSASVLERIRAEDAAAGIG